MACKPVRVRWTPERIEQARGCFADSTTIPQALALVADRLGVEVGYPVVKSAFANAKLNPPGSYLQKAEPAADALRAHDTREESSRDKRTIKELIERLREAEGRQAFLDEIGCHREPPKILPRERKSGMREMTAVALLSDCHVEETVEAESVEYRNEYNLDIADARLTRYFNGIIWNIEHHRASKHVAIRDLILAPMGDLMTGYIHDELVEGNSLSPTQTMLWLLPRMRNGIATVLERTQLDQIVLPCSFGNHGRTTAKPRIATAYKNSFEWLLYHQLASEFKNEKRIRFEITASAHQYVKAYDFTLHFHHGDSVKYGGGVGGLGVPLLKKIPAWDLIRRADYHHVGHFHQYSDFGRVLVNGSLIGYGPYSQWICATYEPPQQMFYLLDKSRGKCQVTPIWVGEDADTRRAAA